MSAKRKNAVEFNFHVSSELYSQLSILLEAGLGLSAIARLAIRKCSGQPLDEDVDKSFPKRLLLYLNADDAKILDELAITEVGRSRAKTLRRLITTYLRINSSSIKALF